MLFIQNILKITEITLKILGKESKRNFQSELSPIQCLTLLRLATKSLWILKLMRNVFNNYFTFIVEKNKCYIKFLAKRYIDYLSNTIKSTFFNFNWQKWNIFCIFSRLTEIIGPISIPEKIMKLLKNNIS